MNRINMIKASFLGLCLACGVAEGGLRDTLKEARDGFSGSAGDAGPGAQAASDETAQSSGNSAVAALSSNQIIAGLKEGLSVGVRRAVETLGTEDGFLKDPQVRIPLPDTLQKLEGGLRLAGQGALADEFIATMNHAAEQAVPQAASILADAVTAMSFEDARRILTGPEDAATRYFREHSWEQLEAALLPIVQQATAETGVTAAYKSLMSQAGGITQRFLSDDQLDLDRYVTTEALDGLFTKVAAEEAAIRNDPVERTTDLLQQVFGAL